MGLKLVRRLAITLVVLGALFAGLNIVAERVAEGRIADAVASRFDLERAPTIDLDAFPIIVSVVRGRLAGLTVSARDLTVEDLAVEQLQVVLRDVAVTGGLLGGGDLGVEVGEGRIDAHIAQGAINKLLKRRGESARVRLSDGRVRVTGRGSFLGAERRYDATGSVRVAKQRLIFEPERVSVDGRRPSGPEAEIARQATSFDVRIPELPGGFRATGAEPVAGALVLRATLTGKKISLSGE